MRTLALMLLVVLLTACSSGSELVGSWRTKDGDITTMVLLKDHTGHFINETRNLSAPIKKWWKDGEVFRYVNAKDAEQASKVVTVDANVLALEEPLGSGHVQLYERVH